MKFRTVLSVALATAAFSFMVDAEDLKRQIAAEEAARPVIDTQLPRTKTATKAAPTSTSTLTTTPPTTPSADSCPLNKGFVPLEVLPDADVCSSKNQNAFTHGAFDGPTACNVPIGSNGERMYHWLPKGKSLDARRAQRKDAGLNPDTWAPWTHRPVCAEQGKYCVFSNAAIPDLALGSQPEIVVSNRSTPTQHTANANATTTLFTPEKNALYNSKWDALPGTYTDKEALFQGMSVLTTPEMAAGDLDPRNFALDADALVQYDYFSRLPAAYQIQQIADVADVPYVESAVVDRREKAERDKADSDYRAEIQKQFLASQKQFEAAETDPEGGADAEDEAEPFPDADDDEDDEDDDDDEDDGDDFGDIVIEDDDAAPETSAEADARPGNKAPVEPSTFKGWGAVAVRDIAAGEPILMERPAIVAHDTLFLSGDDDAAVHGSHLAAHEDDHGLALESVATRARLWKTMVDNLPPAAAARVRSLHVLPKYRGDVQARPADLDAMNTTSSDYLARDYAFRNSASQLSLEEKVFASNALAMRVSGYRLQGLFPRIAVLNHDCVPNAVAAWSEAPLAMVVYAKRAIKAGEELTLNYLNDDLTFKARSLMTGHRFNFQCQCGLCRAHRASPAARKASNDRRDVLKYEIPSLVQSAVGIGRIDLALQAHLLGSQYLADEGLRQPGTVYEPDIGLFRGLAAADATTRVPVADAFGLQGVNIGVGELLAREGQYQEALPYLRAALVEIAWQSAGYMTPAQESLQAALFVLVEAVEARVSQQDRARGGDGVSVLTEAKTSAQDAVAPTMDADQIADALNAIIDGMEENESLHAHGRDVADE